MKLIDYSGKLNNHKEYLEILNKLKTRCNYIEYVIVNDDDDSELTKKFKDLILLEKESKKWWGTKSNHKRKLYRLKWSNDIYKYLKNFETFCKYFFSDSGDIAEDTSFGQNDIAFFDDKDLPLLFTTTHEGFITIRDDLLL